MLSITHCPAFPDVMVAISRVTLSSAREMTRPCAAGLTY